MQILLNSDNHIAGTLDLTDRVELAIHRALGRFSDRLTRVEVHLKDVNSVKGGNDDIVCTMEGRLRGCPPVTVTERGANVALAVNSAAGTLQTALERTLGKLGERR